MSDKLLSLFLSKTTAMQEERSVAASTITQDNGSTLMDVESIQSAVDQHDKDLARLLEMQERQTEDMKLSDSAWRNQVLDCRRNLREQSQVLEEMELKTQSYLSNIQNLKSTVDLKHEEFDSILNDLANQVRQQKEAQLQVNNDLKLTKEENKSLKEQMEKMGSTWDAKLTTATQDSKEADFKTSQAMETLSQQVTHLESQLQHIQSLSSRQPVAEESTEKSIVLSVDQEQQVKELIEKELQLVFAKMRDMDQHLKQHDIDILANRNKLGDYKEKDDSMWDISEINSCNDETSNEEVGSDNEESKTSTTRYSVYRKKVQMVHAKLTLQNSGGDDIEIAKNDAVCTGDDKAITENNDTVSKRDTCDQNELEHNGDDVEVTKNDTFSTRNTSFDQSVVEGHRDGVEITKNSSASIGTDIIDRLDSQLQEQNLKFIRIEAQLQKQREEFQAALEEQSKRIDMKNNQKDEVEMDLAEQRQKLRNLESSLQQQMRETLEHHLSTSASPQDNSMASENQNEGPNKDSASDENQKENMENGITQEMKKFIDVVETKINNIQQSVDSNMHETNLVGVDLMEQKQKLEKLEKSTRLKHQEVLDKIEQNNASQQKALSSKTDELGLELTNQKEKVAIFKKVFIEKTQEVSTTMEQNSKQVEERMANNSKQLGEEIASTRKLLEQIREDQDNQKRALQDLQNLLQQQRETMQPTVLETADVNESSRKLDESVKQELQEMIDKYNSIQKAVTIYKYNSMQKAIDGKIDQVVSELSNQKDVVFALKKVVTQQNQESLTKMEQNLKQIGDDLTHTMNTVGQIREDQAKQKRTLDGLENLSPKENEVVGTPLEGNDTKFFEATNVVAKQVDKIRATLSEQQEKISCLREEFQHHCNEFQSNVTETAKCHESLQRKIDQFETWKPDADDEKILEIIRREVKENSQETINAAEHLQNLETKVEKYGEELTFFKNLRSSTHDRYENLRKVIDQICLDVYNTKKSLESILGDLEASKTDVKENVDVAKEQLDIKIETLRHMIETQSVKLDTEKERRQAETKEILKRLETKQIQVDALAKKILEVKEDLYESFVAMQTMKCTEEAEKAILFDTWNKKFNSISARIAELTGEARKADSGDRIEPCTENDGTNIEEKLNPLESKIAALETLLNAHIDDLRMWHENKKDRHTSSTTQQNEYQLLIESVQYHAAKIVENQQLEKAEMRLHQNMEHLGDGTGEDCKINENSVPELELSEHRHKLENLEFSLQQQIREVLQHRLIICGLTRLALLQA